MWGYSFEEDMIMEDLIEMTEGSKLAAELNCINEEDYGDATTNIYVEESMADEPSLVKFKPRLCLRLLEANQLQP